MTTGQGAHGDPGGGGFAAGGLTVLVEGLRFAEGPVWLPDGDLLVCEMFGGRIVRVHPDGTTETAAEIPGCPNGAALGPDGALYVCDNGGAFTPIEFGGQVFPGPFDPAFYRGGAIRRVDLASGAVTTLYTECEGRPLRAPNDLVFDARGGFWFTDHGIRTDTEADRCPLYYALADGSAIVPAVRHTDSANGVGLSPDGSILYYAETFTGRVLRRRIVEAGVVEPLVPGDEWFCLAGLPGYQLLDSLAVDSAGNVCVATLVRGGITVLSPEGETLAFVPTGDRVTTNLCFGGPDLRTAFVTGGASGTVWTTSWPVPGLRLAW